MANQSYFMVQDGFSWFVGVVEDRNDPDLLGRVRVRCLGYHTENLSTMPTSDLPWAHVMHPVTDPSMHGMGNTPSWLVEGSWVVGFFRDAVEKQQPVIIGSLPGVPAAAADHRKGFSDPQHKDSTQLNDQGKKQYAKEDDDGNTSNPTYGPYPLDGTTFSRTSGHKIGESDTNRLARNASHAIIAAKDAATTKDVPIANTSDPDTTSKQIEWDEPLTTTLTSNEKPIYNASYPYNHVYETESGHVKEYDDTSGSDRIQEYHKKGTFYEIDSDGNKVTRVVGNNYEIVAGTSYVNVKGDVNLTIDTNCHTYIKGNWDIQVDGNVTEVIKGNSTQTVSGTLTQSVTGAVSETYSANQTTNITGTLDLDASTEVDIDSALINLN